MSGPLNELLGDAGPPPEWRPAGPVRFSVIVRTQGRRPNSLAEAIGSLAAQTLIPHEVLVVVHASDPGAAVVQQSIAALSPPLNLRVLTAVGGGRSRPLNVGLDAAGGDYICFLDDDDLALPEWLEAFDRAIQTQPGSIPRARTGVQDWATDGTEEPRLPIGEVEEPFAPAFDLLAHVSQNHTPICSVAFPRSIIEHFGIRFDETLAVFEDWDLLMRLAPLAGVISIDSQTSLYRRLDNANAHAAETAEVWERSHAEVISRLSARPLLLPTGDAQRVASAHFRPGEGSQLEIDLADSNRRIDQLTRSPMLWTRTFVSRAWKAMGDRIATRRR